MNKLVLLACFLPLFSFMHSASAATGLPFRSDFEAGNFLEWNGGPETTMSVTTETAASGRYSTKAVMTRGVTTDNYKDYVFGDHVRVGGTAVASTGLWVRFDSRFDTGFAFGTGQNLHKSVIINFEDEYGRRRYQIILNVLNENRQYFVEHLKWNADRSFGGSITGLGSQHIGTPAAVRLGQWDRIKLFIKPNTPGQSNGIVRLWVNGELKMDKTAVAVRENTSYNPNKVIMSNYVMDTTTSGTQRWDNFYVGETDPDASAVRPNPPVLDSVQ
jgi:hypothetical protein